MIKKIISEIILIGLVFLVGGYVGYRHHAFSTPTSDTIRVRDTIKIYIPQYVEKQHIGTDVARLPRIALLNISATDTHDSIDVAIPLERVVYEEPDFRAVVEGYQPRLVEINIFPETQTIIRNIPAKNKGWAINFGPTVCYGITKDGLRLCLGAGATVSYTF